MSALPASRLCARCGDPVDRGPLCELCQPGEVLPIDPGRWDRAVFDELDALCWKHIRTPRAEMRPRQLADAVSEWNAAGRPRPRGEVAGKSGVALAERPDRCPRCGSKRLKANGFAGKMRRWRCLECFRISTTPREQSPPCPHCGAAAHRNGFDCGKQVYCCTDPRCARKFRNKSEAGE